MKIKKSNIGKIKHVKQCRKFTTPEQNTTINTKFIKKSNNKNTVRE